METHKGGSITRKSSIASLDNAQTLLPCCFARKSPVEDKAQLDPLNWGPLTRLRPADPYVFNYPCVLTYYSSRPSNLQKKRPQYNTMQSTQPPLTGLHLARGGSASW